MARVNSGRTSARVASRCRRPCSANCMISVAVHSLVMDPIWNTAAGVACTPVSQLMTPSGHGGHLVTVEDRQGEAPGTRCRAANSSRRCCHRAASVVTVRLLLSGHGRRGQCVRSASASLTALLALNTPRTVMDSMALRARSGETSWAIDTMPTAEIVSVLARSCGVLFQVPRSRGGARRASLTCE